MIKRPSAVALLSDEHLQLTKLSTELAEINGPLDDLASVVAATVSRHLSAEQRYLYPTIRHLLPEGDRLAEQEIGQDTMILRHLNALRSIPSHTTHFRELAAQLKVALVRHARCAATEIFPRLQQLTTQDDLIQLGSRLVSAELSGTTRPHPLTPARPPWNRMVDPLMGAVDRLRDNVSGRKTQPHEL